MGVDEKTNAAIEALETSESQSKKAAKKQAKEAAKAAKVIELMKYERFVLLSDHINIVYYNGMFIIEFRKPNTKQLLQQPVE